MGALLMSESGRAQPASPGLSSHVSRTGAASMPSLPLGRSSGRASLHAAAPSASRPTQPAESLRSLLDRICWSILMHLPPPLPRRTLGPARCAPSSNGRARPCSFRRADKSRRSARGALPDACRSRRCCCVSLCQGRASAPDAAGRRACCSPGVAAPRLLFLHASGCQRSLASPARCGLVTTFVCPASSSMRG
jgi:hypothetical protein